MNYLELWVGNPKKSLDLSQEFQISLQYSISDIRDISKRNAAFSKTIILPGTKRNNTILGGLYDPNADFSQFNPNVKTPCQLIVNSEVVMTGFLQLRNIKKLNNTDQSGNLIYWEVVIFNSVVDLMTELGEKTMDEIDLLELTHPYTVGSITQSWSSDWNDGWTYPMYGFESQPSTYKVTDFYPSYFSKYLFNSMLQQSGFGWTGSLFTNSQFEKETLPFVGSGSQSIGQATIDLKNLRVGITQSFTIANTFSQHTTGPNLFSIVLGGNSWSPQAIPQLTGGLSGDIQYILNDDSTQFPQTPENSYYDNGGDWDTATSIWTTSRTRKWSPLWRLNYDYHIDNLSTTRRMWSFAADHNVITTGGGGYPVPTSQNKAWNYFYLDFHHTLEWEKIITVPILGGTVAVWQTWDSVVVTKKIPTGGPGPTTSNIGGTVSRTGQWEPLETKSVNVDFIRNSNELVLPAGTRVRLKVRVLPSSNLPQNEYTYTLTQPNGVTFSHYLGQQGGISFAFRNAGGAIQPAQPSVDKLRTRIVPRTSPQNFFFNNGVPFAAQEGDDIFARDFLSSKLKQKDFLNDLIKRYNLYIQPDPNNDRKLIIDTRPDFYSRNLQLDWTKKKDLLTEDKWTILSELQFKEALFTMKADDDFHNKDYTSQTGDVYGQFKWLFGNEFVKDVQKIESPISPTPLVKTPFGAITPALSTDDPKVNTRVLYWGGLKPTIGGGQWVLQGLTQSFTYSVYPYAGHFDDPITPGLDIHFGTPKYLYYNNITTMPTKTMWQTYWSDYITQIEEGRMLTAKFYLDEVDVRTIRDNFWAKIWIFNSWYYVNKIIDYQPLQRGLTTVELLKIKDGVQADDITPISAPVRNPIKVLPPNPIGGVNIGIGNDMEAGFGVVVGNGNSGGGVQYTPDGLIRVRRNIVLGDENVVKSYNGINIGDRNTIEAERAVILQSDDVIVNADDIVVIGNKEGRTFDEADTAYIGTDIRADFISKDALYPNYSRGVNIKVEERDLGQEQWKSIPEWKEVVLSDRKTTRVEELDVWGSLIIEGNTSTQSFGSSVIWEKAKVEVDRNVNITGVITIGGQLDIGVPNPNQLTYLTPQYGVIHLTQSQTGTGVNQLVNLNYLRAGSGISISSNRIYIANVGTYKMDVTILVENAGNGVRDITFWLKFNGTDYPLSAHYSSVPAQKNNTTPSDTIINFDFIGTSINPNDYVELWWKAENTDLTLRSKPGFGLLPDSPSVTINIHRL